MTSLSFMWGSESVWEECECQCAVPNSLSKCQIQHRGMLSYLELTLECSTELVITREVHTVVKNMDKLECLLNNWNDDISTSLPPVLVTVFRLCNLFLSCILFISVGYTYMSKKYISVLYVLSSCLQKGRFGTFMLILLLILFLKIVPIKFWIGWKYSSF